MRRELGVESKLLEVLRDVDGGQRLGVQSLRGGLLGVALVDQLLEAHRDEVVAGQVRVLVGVAAHPLDLVLVRALELAAAQDLLHHALDAVDDEHLLHLGLLLRGQLAVHLAQGLAVLT